MTRTVGSRAASTVADTVATVPWCETCSKYLTPTGLHADGTCPTCGATVGEGERRPQEVVADEGTPWHFKLLIGAVALYLLWRTIQMIGWLF